MGSSASTILISRPRFISSTHHSMQLQIDGKNRLKNASQLKFIIGFHKKNTLNFQWTPHQNFMFRSAAQPCNPELAPPEPTWSAESSFISEADWAWVRVGWAPSPLAGHSSCRHRVQDCSLWDPPIVYHPRAPDGTQSLTHCTRVKYWNIHHVDRQLWQMTSHLPGLGDPSVEDWGGGTKAPSVKL